MSSYVFFYGRECPHCHAVMPFIDRLIAGGNDIKKLEVWHSEKNADYMKSFKEIILNACGGALGVPVLVDIERGRALCGERPYNEIAAWIEG